jgi:CheY-like chemotaxis protein
MRPDDIVLISREIVMSATGTSENATALQGRTILVVEDEYFLATEISRALAKAGAEVVGPFPTVAEAWAAVAREPPVSAGLIDINLRGEMVYPLADLLRQRGIPFVFMTGYDRAALPAAYRDVPICDKPVNIRDFVLQLAAVTGA